MPGLIYSIEDKDPEDEYYHTDPRCGYTKNIIRNRNEAEGFIRSRHYNFRTEDGRTLQHCPHCFSGR